jgi:hypothetical protein
MDIFAEQIHNLGSFRPRTDQAHLAPYYVEELQRFVEAELAQLHTQFCGCLITFLPWN